MLISIDLKSQIKGAEKKIDNHLRFFRRRSGSGSEKIGEKWGNGIGQDVIISACLAEIIAGWVLFINKS
ncbi:hypothetical protein [Mucilaginibacter gynuensis]|uniref:hypothetical protein n=1 Tax=Mucilaginibacter gynuensis TaxID=1302236 RepID=UPI0031E6CB77